MTYIEFLVKDAAENICSALTNPPDQVILIGDKAKLLKNHAARYAQFFEKRGIQIRFSYRTVNRNQIQSIIDTLSELVETYDDCVFDLTGGEELYLVATGIVFGRYPEKKIRMHRFNIRNNTIYDCDQDGITIYNGELLPLTVEENIRIYGGDIVYDDQKPDTTHRWNMDAEFKADVARMWDICRKDVREWNVQMGIFAAAELFCDENSSLTVVAPTSELMGHLNVSSSRFLRQNRILRELKAGGLLQTFHTDNQFVTITYKKRAGQKVPDQGRTSSGNESFLCGIGCARRGRNTCI